MELTLREAIRQALRDEMREDPTVLLFGEDVAGAGGVFKVSAGLLSEFGPDRVRDTPISETAILGAAVGAAASGFRPVVDLMIAEFFGVALDQVVTQAAKMHYLSHGQLRMPIVIRSTVGAGLGFGCQHSQTLETWFMNTPGLYLASASRPRQAYGTMRAAIRSDNPVVFLEPKSLYNTKESFEPSQSLRVPPGRAEVVHEGSDVTVVAFGQMVPVALAAAEQLAAEISCEVIDLCWLVPWDRELVAASVGRTGRLVIVEENPFTGGWGNEIAGYVAGRCFDSLRSAIARVTCPDAPVPHSPPLERAYLPTPGDVVDTVRSVLRNRSAPPPRWQGWQHGATAEPASGTAAALRERRETLRNDPLAQLERMIEIRLVEDNVKELFLEGLVFGTTHTCQGQEAVSVGVAATTRVTDTVTCTYRGHGHALALGLTPEAVLAEILGRRDGCVGGKGGSMHLSAPAVGLLPTFAVVGAGIAVADGAAFAARLRGTDDVAIALFGDGAANTGAFHEGLNLAAIWRLPVVFVCENNLYGEYTRIDRTTPVVDIASRAVAYAIPGEVVDGQDLTAVGAAMERAVARARSGGGATLLEMKTYRYAGHSRGDPAKYRPAGELEAWQKRDPIALFERSLIERGVATQDEIAEVHQRIEIQVAASVVAARASPEPEVAEILEHVTAPEAAALPEAEAIR